jgi:hypothetical protein
MALYKLGFLFRYEIQNGGLYSLALIIFVVSEKKAFEHFPMWYNVKLCPAVVAILNFRSANDSQV